MTRLFDPARHELLARRAWDEAAVRDWIECFAADAHTDVDAEGAWPPHPRDREDDAGGVPYTPLYHGAAGMIWALDALERCGFVPPGRDFRAAMPALIERNRVEVKAAQWGDESLLLGQSGVLLLDWRLAPSPAGAERLAASIVRNAAHPSNEMLWGVPGTLHAAAALYEATGDSRWANAWIDGARSLVASLTFDPDAQCELWTQDLYGRRVRYLGAGHGFAGNAAALLRGLHLLDAAERESLRERIVETVLRTAIRCEGRTNWTPLPGDEPDRGLVQWCHGAPGTIISVASLDDPRLDAVLHEAGALVEQAGPLVKGGGLCHGTAGNGFAFLKLYRRGGEQRWIDAARAFALHAMAQCDAEAVVYGRRRWSLWTGDAGVALYAAACIDGTAVLPPLDPEQVNPDLSTASRH